MLSEYGVAAVFAALCGALPVVIMMLRNARAEARDLRAQLGRYRKAEMSAMRPTESAVRRIA